MNRTSFLKTCVAGTCGFGLLSTATTAGANHLQPENDCSLQKSWITEMLKQLSTMDEESAKIMLKNMSSIHYQQLQMDKMLGPYVGNLQGFIDFIEKEWDWKIFYDKEKNTIIVDENKDHCVCPMINQEMANSPLICHCSEGFAEKMFSKVTGEKVNAVVISSVLRGDKSCIYKINI